MVTQLRIFAAFVCIAISLQSTRTQIRSQGGFKIGIETLNSLTAETGAFSRDPGLSINGFTSIDISRSVRSLISVRLELGLTKAIQYWHHYETVAASNYATYRYVLDLKSRYDFLEVSILPEYMISLSDNVVCTVYAGPSIALYKETLHSAEVSKVLSDSLPSWGGYGPFGEYNMDAGGWSEGLNVGATVRFAPAIVEVRYKYIFLSHRATVMNNLRNLFVQVGVLL